MMYSGKKKAKNVENPVCKEVEGSGKACIFFKPFFMTNNSRRGVPLFIVNNCKGKSSGMGGSHCRACQIFKIF